MSVTWQIKSEREWEAEYVQKHGVMEYTKRLAVANEKAKELDENGKNWEEATALRAQFHSIAMQLSPENFEKITLMSARKWAAFVYKLAGV
jgi:hypothetical protein